MAGQGSRSAMLVLLGTVAVVLLSCRGAAATTYKVGNTTWAFPSSNDSTFYDDWSAKQQFVVGDIIEFKYDKSNHDVASLNTSAAFDQCNTSQAIVQPVTGDTKIELKSPGTKWYICQIGGHCNLGMKVKIVVLEAAAEAPTPAVAPTSGGPPIPGGTPAEAPSPTNAAAPRFSTAIGYGTAVAVVISVASFFL